MKRWVSVSAFVLGITIESTLGWGQINLPPIYPHGIQFGSSDAFQGVVNCFKAMGFQVEQDGTTIQIYQDVRDGRVALSIQTDDNLSLWSLIENPRRDPRRQVIITIQSGFMKIIDRTHSIDFSDIQSIGKIFDALREKGVFIDLIGGTALKHWVDSTLGWRKGVNRSLIESGFAQTDNMDSGSKWLYRYDHPGMFKRSRSFEVHVRLIDYMADTSVLCDVHVIGNQGTLRSAPESRVVLRVTDIKSLEIFRELLNRLKDQTSSRRASAMLDGLAKGGYERMFSGQEIARELEIGESRSLVERSIWGNVLGTEVRLSDLNDSQEEYLAEYMARVFRAQIEDGGDRDTALKDIESSMNDLGIRGVDLHSQEALKIKLGLMLNGSRFGFSRDWLPRFREVFLERGIRAFER